MKKQWKILLALLPILLVGGIYSYLHAKKVSEQSCAEIFNQLDNKGKIFWTHGYVSALSNVTLAAEGFISELKKGDSREAGIMIHAVKTFSALFNYGGSVQSLSDEISYLCKKNPRAPLMDIAFTAWQNLTQSH